MFLSDPEIQSHLATNRPEKSSRMPVINLSRRGFVSGTGGLVVGLTLVSACSPAETPVEQEVKAEPKPSPLTDIKGQDATPSLFINIEEDGQVKIICHRSEMGQQTWTAMTQLIADEMEADWEKIELVQAVGDKKYGNQNTDGSTSVRLNFHRLRVCGAAMRTMLERAAAKKWDVDVKDCKAELGQVRHTSNGKSLGYGELADLAGDMDIPAEAEINLKERKDWRYIGKAQPSLTVPKIVKGEGTFGIDVRLPDMVYAVVARPPQLYAKPLSVDEQQALAVPGVIKTVKMPELAAPPMFKPLGGIAVVAKDTWAAIKGREALDMEWDAGPNAGYNSGEYMAQMLETAGKPGDVRRNRGDFDTALENAAQTVEAEYSAPHLSQAPMEAPAAVARWTGDKVECWACTQTPQAARRTVAEVCGVTEEDVTINVTLLGGAFGRKSKPDFIAEAALIARDIGRPVKLTWTREDALQHGYYHSVSAQKLMAGLDENGKCTALLHRTVFPTIMSTFAPDQDNPSWGELRLGAADTPFDVPNLRLETGKAKAHVRIGWLRSVANVYHAFAVQSFVAEMAHAAGRDQRDFLLELYGPPRNVDPTKEGAEYDNYGGSMDEYPIDTGRLANVTNVAADMAGWGRKMPPGRGLGIATHRSFLSYVSTAVEVEVDDDGQLTIHNVWSAIDAGTVVNPLHTTAQVEGGTLYGLSNALYGNITAKNGIVEQANFPDWRIMRMSEAPRKMEVKIIESNAPPGGVGEPPTPPAAPALANAVFNATGRRIRSLPLMSAGATKLNLG